MRRLAFLVLVLAAAATAQDAAAQIAQVPGVPGSMVFRRAGHTLYGDWRADVVIDDVRWMPDLPLRVAMVFTFDQNQIAGLAAAGIKADKLCLLVTAERTFDADGWLRLASDERMSTLLTPAGLAIEGGVQGAVTNRYGYEFRTPLDQLVTLPLSEIGEGAGSSRTARFATSATLPSDLPPGLYRLRFDIGVVAGTRTYNLNGYSFAQRGFSEQAGTNPYFYSPIVAADGTHVSRGAVKASSIQARIPWLLLSGYNSNGYRGVVADEDRGRFATSDRNLIPDEVILPMFDDGGNRLSYSLEPQFPADTIDALQSLAWNWTTGELAVRLTAPDGTSVDLGTAPFVAKATNGPTTKNTAFTSWKPQAYGRYVVTARGWIADESGRRVEGGGTFRFWIAKRMTLATATFQGMPYPVGSTYGRDIQFNPPLAADVQVSAALYVNSNSGDVRRLTYAGKASPSGIFGAAQGMKPFALSAPGEYHAEILATATDSDGHLWVSVMRHAGVVYAGDGPVVARGKKLAISGKYVDRGDTKFEGYVEENGTSHLAHITFPYLAGDVLLIASDGQGANKIEPVLTYQMRGDTSAWDTRLNSVGTSNLRITTSNGYSPHLFPEYINRMEYYYAAAPRPGFMGRFLVGESNVRAPYWSVSPNSFGGQVGASANGDAPGDIYRLIGGIVLRRPLQEPMYSGYIASAFLLPKGSNGNRVVAAGDEDLHGPLGTKARFFLVGLRPGSAFEVGSSFRPAIQIDPLLPVTISFTLTYPDGRTQKAEGTGDPFGSFAGTAAWPLDVPGVYRYRVTGTWNGFRGGMPGLASDEGEFYVYSRARPAGASGLRLDGSTQRAFPAATGVTITGSSTAASVRYAVITPGAVIAQGELPVSGGKFRYIFDPAEAHAAVPLYDIVNNSTGRAQLGRVVHVTFFSQEKSGAGTYFDFARVILRGAVAVLPRTGVPAAASVAEGSVASPAPAPAARPLVATDTRAIREADGEIARLTREGSLRVVRRDADTLLPGVLHERLQQYHRGVPVAGAEVTRQIRDGVTISVFGTIHERIDVNTAAVVPVDDPRASLVVLPLPGREYRLAWQLPLSEGATPPIRFVDATTGELLGTNSPVVPGEIERFPAGDGRRAIANVASFYAKTLGHRRLPAIDGLADSAAPLDVVAHVMTHALVQPSSRSLPSSETVLLDEAFAVLVGAAVSHAPIAGLSAEERDLVVKIFYRAFVYMLPADAAALTARAAVQQSARDLSPANTTIAEAIALTWVALGFDAR